MQIFYACEIFRDMFVIHRAKLETHINTMQKGDDKSTASRNGNR